MSESLSISDAADSLVACMACDARDWSLVKNDAWIYGIICGWDDALDEVAERFGWEEGSKALLRSLHEEFRKATTEAREQGVDDARK